MYKQVILNIQFGKLHNFQHQELFSTLYLKNNNNNMENSCCFRSRIGIWEHLQLLLRASEKIFMNTFKSFVTKYIYGKFDANT